MTTSTPASSHSPNHHAHYPAFAGVGGLLAALSFTVGRGADADLAIRLTGVGPGDDVVDIGCGPGVAARRAVASVDSVVGIDPAPVMLRVARVLTARVAVRRRCATSRAPPKRYRSRTIRPPWCGHWQPCTTGATSTLVSRRSAGCSVLRVVCSPSSAASNRGRGLASHGWTDDQARMLRRTVRRRRLRRRRSRSPRHRPPPRRLRPCDRHPDRSAQRDPDHVVDDLGAVGAQLARPAVVRRQDALTGRHVEHRAVLGAPQQHVPGERDPTQWRRLVRALALERAPCAAAFATVTGTPSTSTVVVSPGSR